MAQREKTMVLSFPRKELRHPPFELEFELTRVLARVLSACANDRTLNDLQRSLRIEQNSLAGFVGFLSLNGFLERHSDSSNESTFRQSEKGARLLDAFVTMYRAAADVPSGHPNQPNFRTHYAPCNNCARHSYYPESPPVTLHANGECQLCHTSPSH